MELGCRAIWRRCASHWRRGTGTSMTASPPPAKVTRVTCQAVPSHPATVRALHCPSSSTVCSPAVGSAWLGGSRKLSVTGQSRLCWSCHNVVSRSELFCPSCRSLQPPDHSQDYFQILHCDRSYEINIQELQRKYRNLQRSLHPDYFSQKSQLERDISDQQSSLVNKAYDTLLSPLSRGIYLLGIHGITLPEGTEGDMDVPFLTEILEVNEQLIDANSDVEIEEIGNVIQEKCQELIENVREAFQKDDLEGAKTFLTKMKYYTNILEQVKKKILP
ncbi:iron-sulfur cluster co-chaperone protein HscB [Pyxicephalus adspersus]|uniref:Iron-sulfur cluster co-chaperone protein HscB n=1 Tax=Pyxicephalus adspersus TaxID=30357 RepID=A0AAV3ABU2_PYXAD|nr:TPA: hypothetical protein GDO54_013923 [Pyxicephalus adspersus]